MASANKDIKLVEVSVIQAVIRSYLFTNPEKKDVLYECRQTKV
jgi:hypothetical protein